MFQALQCNAVTAFHLCWHKMSMAQVQICASWQLLLILLCCRVRYIHTASACAYSKVSAFMQTHDVVLMCMFDKPQEQVVVQHALCKQTL